MDASEESGVIDSVEGLGKIHCHRHHTSWWTVLVKPRGNLVSQRQERSGGGASRSEAVLGVCELDVRRDELEHQFLDDLGGGTQERDGPVGGPLFLGFSRF